MSTESKKSTSNGFEDSVTLEEQQKKINEVRKLIEPLSDKMSLYCSNASISRYLKARNWNVKKATKMLKATLKWRKEYKPDEIRWVAENIVLSRLMGSTNDKHDEVSHEAETGKIYRSKYMDKHGRTVLVMRPRCQNSKSTKTQIRYLVYCMENAILNLPPGEEQMVWLIDFHGFTMSNISIKVTRETANVLQEHYPERLGVAILYDAPKFFEPFWKVVKPFLETKTANKVKFVYSDDPVTKKTMEELFNIDHLESAFGGKDDEHFDINKYAARMKEDDKTMTTFWTRGVGAGTALTPASACSPVISDSDSSEEKADKSSSHDIDEEEIMAEAKLLINESNGKGKLIES